MHRLDSFSPALADSLRRASDSKRHDAVARACLAVVSEVNISDPDLDAALRTYCTGQPLRGRALANLKRLGKRLDKSYFVLQDETKRAGPDRAEYLTVFAKARAVAAVLAAVTDGSPEAAMDAIYEAANATGDKDRLVTQLQRILG